MRLSLAFVLIVFGIWEIIQPVYWNYYLPRFIGKLANANILVVIHGFLILALGIAVLVGAYLRISSGLAALMILAILVELVASTGFTDIFVRDVTIFLLALALFFDETRYMHLTK